MNYNRKLYPSLLVITGIALAGCSTINPSLKTDTDEIIRLKQQLSTRNHEISSLKSSVGTMQEKLVSQTNKASSSGIGAGGELLPPNAKPGECYTRAYIPAQYKTTTERMLLSDATEKVQTIPATYTWGTERVLIKEASEKLEVIPATYAWEEQRITVTPASSRLISIPATYGTETQNILIKAEHTQWKKGNGPINKVDAATGEIMCLVTVPAVYKTISKKILKSPPTTREEAIPAVYKTIKKKVLKTPPTTRKIAIPAAYKTVKVKKLATPPQQHRTPVSAKYQTVTKRVKTSDSHMEWRPILCKTNVTPGVIRNLQSALKRANYFTGTADGKLGPSTLKAVSNYQVEKNLARGGLTLQTLKSLNIGF